MRDSLPLPRPGRLTRGWPLLLVMVVAASLVWLLPRLGVVTDLPAPLADPARGLLGLATVFLGLFIEAVPFLLLGVVVSSLLHLFVGEDLLTRLTPRHPLPATLGGALLGLIFPVCECGVVPVSRRLMQKGAPISLGVAFLLAAPVINPVVILSTWVAFGGDWRIVAWRVGLTLLIAVAIGLVFATHRAPGTLLRGDATAGDACCGPPHPHAHGSADVGARLRQVVWHSGAEFVEMSRFLILGALLAAAMQTFVPRAALLELGATPVTSVLVMLGLAVVLSVCSTVDAFLALAFASAFSTGSVLAFLVFGPMIDIKSTLMFLGVFRRRAVAVIVLLAFQMVVLASLLITFTWG
jgi:uncharacterized membrane protein YraQ (UPF0718 family)